MKYERPLQTGRLLKRYKRFLSDIRLDDGAELTAHCANTGSMKNCQPENGRVWVFDSQNPKRKLPMSWEWIEIEGQYKACINTSRANTLVKEALLNHVIKELPEITEEQLKSEPKVEEGRLDFLIQQNANEIYIEVKNVTLLEDDGMGYFPDAVTTRGAKHLEVLKRLKSEGKRAILLFCVSHEGIHQVKPAAHIDSKYTEAIKEAVEHGVEVLAYKATFVTNDTASELFLETAIPVILD